MSGAVIKLDPRLDLRAAGGLTHLLLAERGQDLELDAGKVEMIGALTVQVIRSAARSWAEDGHALSFTHASIDLTDQLVLLGFAPDTVTKWGGGR